MKESKFLINYQNKMKAVLHKVESGALTGIDGRNALDRLKNKREELVAKREKALKELLKQHEKFVFYKKGNCYRERSYCCLPSPLKSNLRLS